MRMVKQFFHAGLVLFLITSEVEVSRIDKIQTIVKNILCIKKLNDYSGGDGFKTKFNASSGVVKDGFLQENSSLSKPFPELIGDGGLPSKMEGLIGNQSKILKLFRDNKIQNNPDDNKSVKREEGIIGNVDRKVIVHISIHPNEAPEKSPIKISNSKPFEETAKHPESRISRPEIVHKVKSKPKLGKNKNVLSACDDNSCSNRTDEDDKEEEQGDADDDGDDDGDDDTDDDGDDDDDRDFFRWRRRHRRWPRWSSDWIPFSCSKYCCGCSDCC